MRKPEVAAFYDHRTSPIQYVLSDPQTKSCAIVDPVLDFDEKSGSTATHNADALIAYIRNQNLQLQWILDTSACRSLFGSRLFEGADRRANGHRRPCFRRPEDLVGNL